MSRRKPNPAPEWQRLPRSLTRFTGFAVYWLNQRMMAFGAATMRGVGVDLGPREVGVLMLVDELGPRTQKAIGAALRIEKATMVKILSDLEERGYAERRASPDDGRANLVALRPAGREVLRKVAAISERAHEAMLASLTPGERAIFREILEKLLTAPNLEETAE